MAYLGIPQNTIAVLQKYHFNFQKKFGQNFLIDTTVLDRIISSAEITKEDCVLEIGPGFGVLTAELCRRAEKVVAIELDDRLPPILAETLAEFKNVTIVQGDAMVLDLPALIAEHFAGMPVVVCANLPYYITSPIIMRLLEGPLPIRSLTVMVQKEAAVRITAAPGTRECGAISAAVWYYSTPKLLFPVLRGSFLPAPAVDSAVIRLDLPQELPEDLPPREDFFAVVRAGFGQRRKTMLNSLSAGLRWEKDATRALLTAAGIAENTRAEQVTLEQWKALTRAYFSMKKSR